MTGLSRATVLLGQANGTEVELVVSGTELYASYETVDGFPAVYDKGLGLFCYARLVAGRFQSTGTPVAEAPPPGVIAHAKESDTVRAEKIARRSSEMEWRAKS